MNEQQPQQTPEIQRKTEGQDDRLMLREVLIHLKCLTRLENNVLTIPFNGRLYKLKLPTPTQDASQLAFVDSGTFKDLPVLITLSKLIAHNGVIVDVGAHIGNSTIFLTTQCNAAMTLAFEPTDLSCTVLRENLALNGVSNVKVYNFALGEAISRGCMLEQQLNLVDSARIRIMPGKQGPVDIVSLDSLNLDKLDLLNIDVEGMQLDVLKGAKQTLKSAKPAVCIRLPYTGRGNPPKELADMLNRELTQPKRLLTEYGYRITQVTATQYIAIHGEDKELSDKLSSLTGGLS